MKKTIWKNLGGALCKKDKFGDIQSPESNVEGNLIDVNTNFLAVAWKGKNGDIAIFDPAKPDRTPANYPMIKEAHLRNVTDLKFSPFRTNILASGGEDGLVKLWDIPQGLLKENMTNEIQKYSGHLKKVSLLEFNPVCADVLTSTSNDSTVHTINIIKSEPISVVHIPEIPTGMAWNHNGSKLCVVSRQHGYLIDPRSKSIAATINTHETNKISKTHFLDENTIISLGASKSHKKEAKLFDLRKISGEKLTENFSKCEFDVDANFFWTFFDASRKLIYAAGKGEYSISMLDANEGTVGYLGKFQTIQRTSICSFPLKLVDYNDLEVMRFFEISSGTIVQSAAHIPRKVKTYDPALYPPVFAGEQAIGIESWISGSNAEPIVKEINTIENKWVSEEVVYVKKAEEVKLSPEEELKQLKVKVETLEQENTKLKSELSEAKNKADKLDEEVKRLNLKLEESAKLEEEVKDLKAKLEAASAQPKPEEPKTEAPPSEAPTTEAPTTDVPPSEEA